MSQLHARKSIGGFLAGKLVSLSLIIFFLTACATQPLSTLSIEEQVALLQKANKFGAAQAILDNAASSDLEAGKVGALRKYNQDIAAQFEVNTITEAKRLQEALEWGSATRLLSSAVDSYPESTALDDAATELQLARNSFLRNKQLEHSILRAKHLPSELDKLRAIDDASTDPALALAYEELQQEADDTAETLLHEGQRLLREKQWQGASQLLRLSLSLRNDQRTTGALRAIEAHYKPKTPTRKVAATTKQVDLAELEEVTINADRLAAASLQRYQELLAQRDYVAAREELDRAARLQTKNREIEEKSRALNGLIDNAVETRVEQGKYEYSQGNIDQAIKHWEYAVSLAPENESLNERLDKARLFKQRYETLKR